MSVLWHSVGVRLDVGCLGVRAASHGEPEDTDPESLVVCAVIVPAAPESGVFERKCGEVQSWFFETFILTNDACSDAVPHNRPVVFASENKTRC